MTIYPKLSIILPVFNGEQYIEKSIQSIINQKYPNLELIVVDGGSYDNTLNILNDYKDVISIFISEKDFGLYHALNKGILASTGSYIGWINADDLYLDNALLTVGEALAKNETIDLLYGEGERIDAKGCSFGLNGAIPYNKSILLNKYDYIPSQACFFKKAALAQVGLFDTSFKWAGDWDLWKRFSIQDNIKIVFLNQILGAWRLHRETLSYGGGSKEYMLKFRETYKSLKKHKTHFLTTSELKLIPYIIVGFLGLRVFLRESRNLLLLVTNNLSRHKQ